MLRYEVKDVVCDYGLYENNELKLILNSRDNALLIKEIMEADKKGIRFLDYIKKANTQSGILDIN